MIRQLVKNPTFIIYPLLLTLSLLVGYSTNTFAQDKWPIRPITMVVPFPPGGVADTGRKTNR
jgi:tripartite-type tricarboxylate transporter receptor subunit TctC